MGDIENKRAQREALAGAAATPATSRHSQIWAGLMRYLSGEMVRQHEQAEKERTSGTEASSCEDRK